MANNSILALDVGEIRIGVALADADVRFANPLTTLANDATVWERLRQLIREHDVRQLVVGLPRNLSGDDTAQTARARSFAEQLQANLELPVQLQDEAATSVKAEAELRVRGKPYQKGDVDALAATYILEDYLGVGGS